MSILNVIRCYVCDSITNKNLALDYIQTTRYSGTSVYTFLEKFVAHELPQRTNINVWCSTCLEKINNYDLAITTAQQVESELLQLFTITISNYKLEATEINTKFSDDKVSTNTIPKSRRSIRKLIDKTLTIPQGSSTIADIQLDHRIVSDKELEKTKAKKSKLSTRKKCMGNYLNNDVCSEPEKQYFRDKGLLFKCERCNIKFENKPELKIHMKSHDGLDKQICDVCGQIYKSKAALDIHVGLHKGVSPHECDKCGKKFTQRGALVRHMPIHTGERPYQCDKCGKQFIHYSSFHMHQLAHNNIRDKKCSVCGLELRSNSHLTRHMRVHSGEKPYSCPTCGQKFAQRYNMMTHFKAHQGVHRANNKTYNCPICQIFCSKQSKLDEHLLAQHNTCATNNKFSNFKPEYDCILVSKEPLLTTMHCGKHSDDIAPNQKLQLENQISKCALQDANIREINEEAISENFT